MVEAVKFVLDLRMLHAPVAGSYIAGSCSLSPSKSPRTGMDPDAVQLTLNDVEKFVLDLRKDHVPFAWSSGASIRPSPSMSPAPCWGIGGGGGGGTTRVKIHAAPTSPSC